MPTDLPLQLQRHNNGWARRPCKQEQAALLRRMLFASLVASLFLTQGAACACTQFTPTRCWYKRPSTEEALVLPKCGAEACAFEESGVLECPFFSSGTYDTVEGDSCDDFMRVEEGRMAAACGEACCRGVVQGEWASDAADAAVREYSPHEGAGCSYSHFRRHEVLDRLLRGDTDIVIAGDSMMRQLYVRLIQMLRGRRQVFDYRVHTHARYDFCDEADMFRTGEYMPDMKQPGVAYCVASVPDFFAPLGANSSGAAELALGACSRPAARIDFLHAPLFSYQVDILGNYIATVPRPGRNLVVISYLGVWTKAGKVPGPYLAMLEDVSATALVAVLSVPTFREQRHPESCAKYEQRSAIMREWAAARPSRALFLDFDALSLAPNAPPTTRSWDKHYMCYTTYPRVSSDPDLVEKLRAVNGLRERAYGNPVGEIWYTTDGECYDEMNRGLWVVLLNALMRTENGDWPAMPEPATVSAAQEAKQTAPVGDQASAGA